MRPSWRPWVLPLFCALLPAPLLALDPARPLDLFFHRTWQARDGLPQNSIEAIVQTRDGYLWLGTQEGLVRFDGARFTVLDRSRTPAMTTNHVQGLLEGSDGSLWAATLGGGLLRFRGRDVHAYTAAQGLSSHSVSALAEDARGRLWIGTQDAGIDVLEGDRIQPLGRERLPSTQVRALLVSRDGAVWVGTAKGLARVQGDKSEVFTTRQGLASDSVTALAEGADGSVWVGTAAGLSRRAGTTFHSYTRRHGLSHEAVRALHADEDGCLWIGTAGGGLSRWHDGAFSTFRAADGLTSETVMALTISREGELWIGTDGGGLNSLREGKLTAYTTRQGLSHPVTYTVTGASRAGAIWAGSYVGHVAILEGSRFRPVIDGAQLRNSRVRTLLEDPAGRLWIGTDDGLFRRESGGLTRMGGEGDGVGAVRALAVDRAGTVWVGTDGAGLFRVEGRRLVPFGPSALRSSQVRDIHEDRQGRLWVATYGGLTMLRDGEVTTFTVADGLAHAYVRTIHESPDGTLWFGTYGGGLSRFRDGRFVSWSVGQGLFSEVIYSILEDAAGDLWMSCNRGIFRVSRAELEEVAAGRRARLAAQAYDEADGMPTRECNGGNPGSWRTADGRMWFPTLGGVVMVDPSRMRSNTVAPPVVIESVLADGAPLERPEELAGRPRRLEFHYAGLSFVAPQRVRYRYRLEGFDSGWVDAGTLRTAHYTSLPPGRYRFRVAACNSDGVWNEQGATWDFRLAPRFRETRWFLPLCALGLAAAGLGLHRWRVHHLRHNEQRLQQRIHDALARIKVLSGLLPICAACKKIRDDKGYWEHVEVYIRDHSQAEFSHGLCPGCLREIYPEFADEVLARSRPAG